MAVFAPLTVGASVGQTDLRRAVQREPVLLDQRRAWVRTAGASPLGASLRVCVSTCWSWARFRGPVTLRHPRRPYVSARSTLVSHAHSSSAKPADPCIACILTDQARGTRDVQGMPSAGPVARGGAGRCRRTGWGTSTVLNSPGETLCHPALGLWDAPPATVASQRSAPLLYVTQILPRRCLNLARLFCGLVASQPAVILYFQGHADPGRASAAGLWQKLRSGSDRLWPSPIPDGALPHAGERLAWRPGLWVYALAPTTIKM